MEKDLVINMKKQGKLGKADDFDESTVKKRILVQQLSGKKVVWHMEYWNEYVPFSKFEDFTADISELIQNVKESGAKIKKK